MSDARDRPPGRRDNDAPVADRVREWLKTQGYPFELKVAGVFQRDGYLVEQSPYYMSAEGKACEIDLLASHGYLFKHDKVEMTVTFDIVAECKSNPKTERPWVVFTAPTNVFAHLFGSKDSLVSPVARAVLDAEGQALDSLLFRRGERTGYAAVCAAIKPGDNSNDDVAYHALVKLADAAFAHFAQYETTGVGGSRCLFVIPVLAVATPLFECWLDASGAIQLEERKHLVLSWTRPVGTKQHETRLHVVQEAGLEDFSRACAEFAEQLRQEHADTLATATVHARRVLKQGQMRGTPTVHSPNEVVIRPGPGGAGRKR